MKVKLLMYLTANQNSPLTKSKKMNANEILLKSNLYTISCEN